MIPNYLTYDEKLMESQCNLAHGTSSEETGLWPNHGTPNFTNTLLLGAGNMKPAPGGK